MINTLRRCPRRLCCVCSQSNTGQYHQIAPLAVHGDPAAAFCQLQTRIIAMPRTKLVTATDTYLHAVCRTLLGFVDDLECCLCASERLIHVRSASRFGFYDIGVNRRRVETLRRQLQESVA